jgi:hypothetical protein
MLIMNGENVTVVPVHAMKMYWGSRDIYPLILNLGPGWGSVVYFLPEKDFLYLLYRKQGAPQSRT